MRLLTEIRFSSYLLYVVGAIILAVIGIFDHLALAAWAEVRKKLRLAGL